MNEDSEDFIRRKKFWLSLAFCNHFSLQIIGVRAGGAGGAAAPPTAEITSFFGQNALDYSGNDT